MRSRRDRDRVRVHSTCTRIKIIAHAQAGWTPTRSVGKNARQTSKNVLPGVPATGESAKRPCVRQSDLNPRFDLQPVWMSALPCTQQLKCCLAKSLIARVKGGTVVVVWT